MNVNPYNTRDYENKSNWTLGENKPNSKPIQTQSNPIASKPKMDVTLYVIKEYEDKPRLQSPGKQSQFKPKQSQFQNPTSTQREAFFAHQRFRVDLPLGKSKQTVTSRPCVCHVWLCNCSSFFTRRNRTGFLLAISLGRVGKLLFIRTVNREVVSELAHPTHGGLAKGNRLEFRDFGVFEPRDRAPRTAQNPKTLEQIHVSGKRVVKFKMGRLMKQRINSQNADALLLLQK